MFNDIVIVNSGLHSQGLCKFESPDASPANAEGEDERDAVTTASRIFASIFLAIISAAFPLGARMNGI
jgi:hypothetical protein